MLVRKVDVEEEFKDLRKPIDLKDWISGPAIVNAFYEPSFNQICNLLLCLLRQIFQVFIA